MSRKETRTQKADEATSLDPQDIIGSIQDELLVIDSNYRVRWANATATAKMKKSADSPIGRPCYEVSYGRDKPCTAPLWDCPLRKVLSSGEMTTVVHPIHTLGSVTYLKVIAYPFRGGRGGDGKPTAIVELRRDVSQDRALDEQILRRHHQLLALNRISTVVSGQQDLDTILKITLDNMLDIVNGSIGGILLMDKEPNVLYYRTHHGLSEEFIKRAKIPMGEGIAGKVAQTGEPVLVEDITKDPRTIHIDVVSAENLKGFISVPLKARDKVVGVMNIASRETGKFGTDDLSLLNSISNYIGTAIEQASLNARLSRARERYRALLRYSLKAQEDERKRIARELHDETAQALTSLTLSLQAAIQMAEAEGFKDSRVIERLKKTHSYAVHAGNEIVKLMRELRPTLLDELGLPAAIHRYAKDTLEAHGMNVSMEFVGTDDRLPPEVEVTLFRVAQGLIGNIMKHSEAKNVSIRLERNDTECVLHIDDDGKGFDLSKITAVEPSGRGAGLFTIRERLRLVNGTDLLETAPGKGTKVTARVPLAKDATSEE